MTPALFNKRAKDAGLHLKNVGPGAVADLASLSKGPVERTKGDWRSAPSKSPLKWMGVLIQHGLAVFAEGSYSITDKGREYLAKLKAEGLL